MLLNFLYFARWPFSYWDKIIEKKTSRKLKYKFKWWIVSYMEDSHKSEKLSTLEDDKYLHFCYTNLHCHTVTLNWQCSLLYTVPQVSMMTDTQQTPTRPQGEARTQMRKCGLLLFHSGIFMQLCTVTAVCCFYSSPPCPPPPFSLQPIVVIANTLHLNMAFMPQMLRFLHYNAW